MELIDTHTHLDDAQFNQDRAGVVQRAGEIGIRQMIVPAIQASAWPALNRLCLQYPILKPAYGMHPMFMAHHREEHLQELEQWLTTGNPVAVGECGLDFFIPEPDKPAQLRLFEAQLELAAEYRLPVIIHARKSVELVIDTLRRFPEVKGVLHSFSGSQQQAEKLIANGFLLGFGGPITYPNARRLRALMAWLPLTALLLETDSPDQPDATHRGERNEPAYLQYIVQAICAIKAIDPEQLAKITTANARTLFNLPVSEDYSAVE